MTTPQGLIDGSVDMFGYHDPGFLRVPARQRFRLERDELSAVMSELRRKYGRRRLFRVADVQAIVEVIRRERRDDGGDTPPTVKRLRYD